MANATFTTKDQNWQAETTTYWFELNGEDYGTGFEFNGDVFGIVEGPSVTDGKSVVDCDGAPVTQGDNIYTAVTNTTAVTDAMRAS